MKSSTTFRFLLYVLLILTPVVLSAQGKQANYWYFGIGAGIDFNAGSPPAVLLDGQTFLATGPNAGSACISDENGIVICSGELRTSPMTCDELNNGNTYTVILN